MVAFVIPVGLSPNAERTTLNAILAEIDARLPLTGTGSPAGVVAAPVGRLYTREDGGANTTLYVKESGTGTTGWVAK